MKLRKIIESSYDELEDADEFGMSPEEIKNAIWDLLPEQISNWEKADDLIDSYLQAGDTDPTSIANIVIDTYYEYGHRTAESDESDEYDELEDADEFSDSASYTDALQELTDMGDALARYLNEMRALPTNFQEGDEAPFVRFGPGNAIWDAESEEFQYGHSEWDEFMGSVYFNGEKWAYDCQEHA